MNLASGLNLMMTSQCHNKRLSLCFVCLGANILLFENDNHDETFSVFYLNISHEYNKRDIFALLQKKI